MELRGLPNTAGAIECVFAESATAALRVIRDGKAASMAGDRGSMNLWRDDNNQLRGDRCFYMRQMELRTFRNASDAAKWYRRTLKKVL